MNQVGDQKTFRVMGTPPSYPAPVYAYKWWDGSVSVTGTYSGSVLKRLNLGGNPAETFTVPFRCEICDTLGNVVQIIADTIAVNNPPTVVPSPTIVPNDQAFPFATQITTRAYDLENTSVQFYWYLGTNPIGGEDTTAQDFTVEGTYYGTLTGLTRNGYTNSFNPTVLSDGTIYTCKLVDDDGGTTSVHYDMRGYDPAAPAFSLAATPESLISNASTLPIQWIAPGQYITFTGYGDDPSPGILRFVWYFYGSNGWTQPGMPLLYYDNGTSVAQGKKSEYRLQIQDETAAGQKVAIVSCTNHSTGRTVYSSIPVRLDMNDAPEISSVGVYHPVSDEEQSSFTKLVLPNRTLVKFSGTASDADNDLITFRWDIYAPPAGQAYTLHGRDGLVDVTDWTTGVKTSIGVVTATDRFGVNSSAFSIPQITLS